VAKYVPVAYSLGFVHIKYVGSQGGSGGPQEEPWEAFYGFAMGGLDFARSLGKVGAKIELKGTARQWGSGAMRPEDLEGMVQHLEASAMLAKDEKLGPSVVPDGVGGAVAALAFMGDLQSNASRQGVLEFVLDAPPKVDKGGKGGAKANLKGLWGYVWSLHDTDPGDITIVSREDEDEGSEFSVYWEKHLGPMAVFFPINGAHFEVPTDDERDYMVEHQLLSPRQALDAFAAAELPMMVNPLSVFKLEGFADAPDGKDANLELSEHRALTVARYFEAILGDRWTGGVPLELQKKQSDSERKHSRVAVIGEGEISNSSNSYNQADRRVDAYVRYEPEKNEKGVEKPISDMDSKASDLSVKLTRETK